MTEGEQLARERFLYLRIFQHTPSPDERRCGVKPGEEAVSCEQPAVARVSYGLWWHDDEGMPEDWPQPSTQFVGACRHHLEDLRMSARLRGGELETLDQQE